jgi:hypothetical protein
MKNLAKFFATRQGQAVWGLAASVAEVAAIICERYHGLFLVPAKVPFG